VLILSHHGISGISSQCWIIASCDCPSIRTGKAFVFGRIATIIHIAIKTIEIFSISEVRQIFNFTTFHIQTQSHVCFLIVALHNHIRVIQLSMKVKMLISNV